MANAKNSLKAPKGLKATANAEPKVEVTVPQTEEQKPEETPVEATEATTEDGVVAVATDNVPEGEPSENEDGSVTAYDENNEPVGTVSAEEVQKAEESVVAVEVDTKSPTEQLNENSPKVDVDLSAKVDEHKKPEERVKIRLRVDHSCCIAMEYYDFKAGKVYTVPKNVKKILNRAGLLSPL